MFLEGSRMTEDVGGGISDEELAEQLGIPVEDYQEIRENLARKPAELLNEKIVAEIKANFPPLLTQQVREHSLLLAPVIDQAMQNVGVLGDDDLANFSLLQQKFGQIDQLLKQPVTDPVAEVTSGLRPLVHLLIPQLWDYFPQSNLGGVVGSIFSKDAFVALGEQLTALPDTRISVSTEKYFPKITAAAWPGK